MHTTPPHMLSVPMVTEVRQLTATQAVRVTQRELVLASLVARP